jgi:hypothetical protein
MLTRSARRIYAPKPNNTKSTSEIHAPKGPPKFLISSEDEKEEKLGSLEL